MDFDMAIAVPGLGAVPANNAPPAIVPAIPLQVQAQIEASENVLAVPGASAAMAVAAMNGGAPANVAAADGDAPANIGRGDAAAAPVATPAAVAASRTFANNVNNLRLVRGVSRNHLLENYPLVVVVFKHTL